MNLIKMDRPICMIASLAMLLDTSIERVLEMADYKADGARSHHPQELIDIASMANVGLVLIEPRPWLEGHGEIEEDWSARLFWHLYKNKGLICIRTPKDSYHMVAWDGYHIYDPNGHITDHLPLEHIHYFMRAYPCK